MDTKEQLNYLISELASEGFVGMDDLKSWMDQHFYASGITLYPSAGDSISSIDDLDVMKNVFRALVNIRPPMPARQEFLALQDEYLGAEIRKRGIVGIDDLNEAKPDIYLWQGDITRLRVDAIVNAANPKMLGCFIPCHGCIDNAIHTYSGIQLRLKCQEIMIKQEHDEPAGFAKITEAYNLPCNYILHTVGPIINNDFTAKDCRLLESCYKSCLELAYKNDLSSIAFCCISTGEYRFPNDTAAEIAVKTVLNFLKEKERNLKVIFNVFKDKDFQIYRRLLR